MISSTVSPAKVNAVSAKASQATTNSLFWLLSPVGLLALVHALSYNYSCDNFPVTFVYDSEFYRQTCSMFIQIVNWLQFGISQAYTHHRFADLAFIGALLSHSSLLVEFIGHIRVDGPVLTVLCAIPCLLTGKSLSLVDWRTVVVLQSFLYSGSVMFTGAIAARLAGNKWVGLMAAILYALYPPACLATNRFLTETAAVFLATALLMLMCASYRTTAGSAGSAASSARESASGAASSATGSAADGARERARDGAASSAAGDVAGTGRALLIGIIAGLAFMLRPAMALSMALPVLCFICSRPRWQEAVRSMFSVGAGAFLAILPWTIFSTTFLGRPLIAPDREPGLNLALGFDIESGGNAVIYMSPFARLTYDPQGPWQAAAGLLHARPIEYLKFLLWKLEKMALFPWNDFHHNFLGIPPGDQWFIHLGLIGLSSFGLISLASVYKQQSDEQKFVYCVCLSFLLGCLPVLLFVTVNRYLFPATPLLAIFGAYAISYVLGCIWGRPQRARLAGASAVWLMIAGSYAMSYNYLSPEARERQLELKAGESLLRKLDIASLPQSSNLDTVILIIDADNLTSDSKVFINGQPLPGAFAPLYYFDSDNYSVVALDELSTAGKRTNVPSIEEMRIWRGLCIPTGLLKNGVNEIKLIQSAGSCTIYGDASKCERRLPSLFLFSDDIFWQNPRRLDGRPDEPILSAGNANREQFLYQRQDKSKIVMSTRPRMRLVFAKRDLDCRASRSDAEVVSVPLPAAAAGAAMVASASASNSTSTSTSGSGSRPRSEALSKSKALSGSEVRSGSTLLSIEGRHAEESEHLTSTSQQTSVSNNNALLVKLPQLAFAPNPEGIKRCSLVVNAQNRSAEYIQKFDPIVGPYHWVEVRGKARAIASNVSQPSVVTTIEFSDVNAAIEVPAQSHINTSKHWSSFCTRGLIAHTSHQSLRSAIIDVNADDIRLLRERGLRPHKYGSFEFADLELRIIPVTIPKCSFKRRIIL